MRYVRQKVKKKEKKTEEQDRESEELGQRRRSYRSKSKVRRRRRGTERRAVRHGWSAERITFIPDFRSYMFDHFLLALTKRCLTDAARLSCTSDNNK